MVGTGPGPGDRLLMKFLIHWVVPIDGPPEGLDPLEVARRAQKLLRGSIRSGHYPTWLVTDTDSQRSYAVDLDELRVIPPGRPADDDDEDSDVGDHGDDGGWRPRWADRGEDDDRARPAQAMDDDEPPF